MSDRFKISFQLLVFLIIIFSGGCKSREIQPYDKAWVIENNEFKSTIMDSLMYYGLTVHEFEDKNILTAKGEFEWQGITWTEIVCSFNNENRCRKVNLKSFYPVESPVYYLLTSKLNKIYGESEIDFDKSFNDHLALKFQTPANMEAYIDAKFNKQDDEYGNITLVVNWINNKQ